MINGGVPGYCPLLSWLQLRHQLMALDPDLIIVLFDMTDVAEDLSYRRFTETSSGGRPLAAIHPSLTQSQQSKSIQDNFVSWQLAQEALTNVFSDQPPDAARQPVDPRTQYAWLTDESTAYDRFVELALSPVQSIRDVARNRGIPVLLAGHPAPWQVSGTASPGARDVRLNGISRGQVIASRRPFALLAQFASEIGLPFCDASTDFLSSRDPDRLFQHQTRGFTAAGTELYARAIVRSLLQSVPGPWESNSGRQNEYKRGTVTPVGGGRNKRGDLNEIMQIPTRDAFDNDLAPVPGHR